MTSHYKCLSSVMTNFAILYFHFLSNMYSSCEMVLAPTCDSIDLYKNIICTIGIVSLPETALKCNRLPSTYEISFSEVFTNSKKSSNSKFHTVYIFILTMLNILLNEKSQEIRHFLFCKVLLNFYHHNKYAQEMVL